MNNVFKVNLFNQDISNWNMSNVSNISWMLLEIISIMVMIQSQIPYPRCKQHYQDVETFNSAESFNQNISGWDG